MNELTETNQSKPKYYVIETEGSNSDLARPMVITEAELDEPMTVVESE